MALNPDLLRQLQSQYGQQVSGIPSVGAAAYANAISVNPYGLKSPGKITIPSQSQSQQIDEPEEGNVAGGILAGVGLGSQMFAQANRNRNIQTAAPSGGDDSAGRPTYNLGGFAQGIDAINTKVNGYNIANDTAQGAAIGSAVPIIGTAVGAAAGFLGGTASELFASNQARRKKRLAQQSLIAAQRSYNSHIAQYNNMQLGEQQYQDLQNPDNRLYNIYRYTTPS